MYNFIRNLIVLLFMLFMMDANGWSIMDDIEITAFFAGVNKNYMCKIADIESGWNPKAKNKIGTARGLFQITKPTERSIRKQYGIIGDIYDPYVNSLMAAYLTQRNKAYLRRKRIKPTFINMYLAHFFGSRNSYIFLITNQDKLAKDVFPKEAIVNASRFKERTLKEVKQLFKKKLKEARGCK